MMVLKSIAVTPAPACKPADTVLDAVNRMVESHFGAVLIMEDGRMKGIFTERDVLVLIQNHGVPEQTRLADVMSSPVQTIPMNATVEKALGIMRSNHFRHLPIVDEAGAPFGMISIREIFGHYVNNLNQICAAMAAYIGADGPGG